MANYYELLKIQPTASPAEINSAIETQYNQWRRLVTHHDPNIVTRANQALQILETIRTTLLDPAKRSVYNTAIGIEPQMGGLGDPEAILSTLVPLVLPRVVHQNSSLPPQPAPLVNVWLCPKCNTANPLKTRFCSKCGEQLGIICPNCSALIRAADLFCTECGKSIDHDHSNMLQWINQTTSLASQMKYLPEIRSVIAKGLFPNIYKTCVEITSSFKYKDLWTSSPIKNIITNPQNGEIYGEMDERCALKLFIQNNTLSVRGVVVVATFKYDTGLGLSPLINQFVKSLLRKSDIFSEVK
jgi:curved DNA-binding protein CbpA